MKEFKRSTVVLCSRCGAELTQERMCPACMLDRGWMGEQAEPALGGSLPPSFGDYEIIEELARGGMGVVYKARQKSLNRMVAVKMILTGRLAKASELQRFRAEAETAAQLQHPNIVAIHEVGEFEGQPFFSMDYVEGKSLAELTHNEPMPARRAAAYLKTIAEAIDYAHSKGVLHRDLKPSNILIDQNDQPRITDFGLAKRLDDSQLSTINNQLTLTGQVLGSPNFMPPEQAAGDRNSAGPASDVYSLGAILYQLLTGRPPFLAETLTQTLRLVAETEPVQPRLLNPSVSRDLETICLTCLQKEPRKRYGNAQDLAAELDRFLRGVPIQARPVGAAAKAWRWCQRKPALTTALVLALVLLLVLGIGSPIALFRINHARLHAETKEKEATERLWDSYLAQAEANRWSGRVGRRFDSLEILKKAAAIHPSLKLRNEAIACMALVDVKVARQWEPNSHTWRTFDVSFDRCARWDTTDNTISVRRLNDDTELMRVSGMKPPLSDAIFSPNGQYLAVICMIEQPYLTMRIWDLERKEIVFDHPESRCRTMAFSPNSSLIALAHDRGQPVTVHSLSTGSYLRALPQGPLVWRLAFDPSGRYLAISSDQDQKVVVRDLENGELIQTLPHPDGVKDISWHPSGRFLATGCMDGSVYVWDVFSAKIERKLKGAEMGVTNAYFNHRGDLLASQAWDGILRLWDVWAERELVSMPAGGAGPFSSDGRWLAAVLDGPKNTILEVNRGLECRTLRSLYPSGKGPASADFSLDGRLLVSGHADGMRLWDLDDFRELAFFATKNSEAVMFHPDGKSLFAAGSEGLDQWPIQYEKRDSTNEVVLGPPLRFGMPTTANIFALSLSPDGRTLALAQGSLVHLFDIETRKERLRLEGQPRLWRVALSPDGKWVAAASFQREFQGIWVWNVATGNLEQKLPFSPSADIAFSPDSKSLAASNLHETRVWEVGAWKSVRAVPRNGSGGSPGVLSMSPDGKMLAFADGRNSIRLLNPETGEEWATLEAPIASGITRLQFDSDGTRLAALCGGVQAIQIWDLPLIRRQLAAMNLDWDLPPLRPPATNRLLGPMTVTVLAGTNQPVAAEGKSRE